MPVSINGWPVLDNPAWGDPRARKDTAPSGKQLWVRDLCWPLFAALTTDYNNWIKPIDISDGYDYRQANAANAWSDHSSGTAVDINYNAEGAQGDANLGWWKTAKRSFYARRIKKMYRVVIWGGNVTCGGDYQHYNDWMHWAIAKGVTEQQVRDVIRLLGIDADGIRHNKANGRPLKSPVVPKR